MADTSPITMVSDVVAGATATGALTTPLWFPMLKEASEIAALILPIIGVVLVAAQIAYYALRLRGKGRHR